MHAQSYQFNDLFPSKGSTSRVGCYKTPSMSLSYTFISLLPKEPQHLPNQFEDY